MTNDGISIFPLGAMRLTQRSSNVRVSSGVKRLDEMCGGGFFKDSIILVTGATGTGKTLLVSKFIEDACKNGDRAILFAYEESRAQLSRNAFSPPPPPLGHRPRGDGAAGSSKNSVRLS